MYEMKDVKVTIYGHFIAERYSLVRLLQIVFCCTHMNFLFWCQRCCNSHLYGIYCKL